MKDYTTIKTYLNLRADLLDNTADTLQKVAEKMPNHKEITRRLCDDDVTYIVDNYSKYFHVRVMATDWDTFKRYGADSQHRMKHTTEMISLFDGDGAQPKTTVADLKQRLLELADRRRKDATEARAAAERVEATDKAYTEATKQFKTIVDDMGYDLRQVLNAEHIRGL